MPSQSRMLPPHQPTTVRASSRIKIDCHPRWLPSHFLSIQSPTITSPAWSMSNGGFDWVSPAKPRSFLLSLRRRRRTRQRRNCTVTLAQHGLPRDQHLKRPIPSVLNPPRGSRPPSAEDRVRGPLDHGPGNLRQSSRQACRMGIWLCIRSIPAWEL